MSDVPTADELAEILSEGLNLCVRARQMDAMDRRQAALAASCDPEAWQADGTFDRYVERHNIEYPHAPISTRSFTVQLWVQEQYDKDLAAWEAEARAVLARHIFPPSSPTGETPASQEIAPTSSSSALIDTKRP